MRWRREGNEEKLRGNFPGAFYIVFGNGIYKIVFADYSIYKYYSIQLMYNILASFYNIDYTVFGHLYFILYDFYDVLTF